MNNQQGSIAATRFYEQAIMTVEDTLAPPDDLCFVYVQHAFTPLLAHLDAVNHRFAALIPKHSSAACNPQVLRQLEARFPGRIFSGITRNQLRNQDFTFPLLQRITRGRPFAILEYGGYFAPIAQALSKDPHLGKQLIGFVEGTENGIAGSCDRSTIGYREIAPGVAKPIVSKSKSGIKTIMDLQIGPAIVKATQALLQAEGADTNQLKGDIGIIGLGSIGRGVLRELNEMHHDPMVHDQDPIVMATLAHEGYRVSALEEILSTSGILFLNTGSCFLSDNPRLLSKIKEDSLLVLCTSGDVEAGVPQLIKNQHLFLQESENKNQVASFVTHSGKRIRILLGSDGVGQAPNMTMEDGSGSVANLMSDMEFYALGALLGASGNEMQPGKINESPHWIQHVIATEWLECFFPSSLGCKQPNVQPGDVEKTVDADPEMDANSGQLAAREPIMPITLNKSPTDAV